MIKNSIVALCILFSTQLLAQEGTSSPYSFYGIGDIKFKGSVENRSMGGISVLPDSIHINIQNPAQLAGLKLSGLALGGTYANTKSLSEDQEGKSRRTSLDYMAIGLPLGKIGIGFGLIPFSSVGYKISKTTQVTNDSGDTIRSIYSKYNGIGGVNKVFLGFGFSLTKKINIGANMQYNFGTIETNGLLYQTDLQYGSRETNVSELSGVNFDLGATYQTKLKGKLSLFSSLIFTPESKLQLSNTRNVQIVQLLSTSAISVIQSENIAVGNSTIKLPSKLALGSGFGEIKKWLLGAEVTFINNSVMSNRFNNITNSSFENSVRYSLGGYFIPNYNSYATYYKRIVYRGGLRYENTGLVIENKSITDFAANVGLGLPLIGTFTNINIGLEVGKRGTTYYNLVQENYFNISVGLSLSDKWFVKRKFD
jgi:hypothetical protein